MSSPITVPDLSTIHYSWNIAIDALLELGLNWNYLNPVRNILYYTFDISTGTESGAPPISAFNAAQIDAARLILTYSSGITGIQFVETPSGNAADFHFSACDIVGSSISGLCSSNYSYSYTGAEQIVTSYSGDAYIYLDNVEFASSNTAPTAGTTGYEVLLHEIGHALGLKHPFETPYTLPTADDNTNNTVMSYTWAGANKTVFQSYDLLALQWIYGGDGLGGVSGNLAPTASNSTVGMNEDGSYVFAGGDFGFADANSGDSLQTVQVTSLPSVGSLRLNGVAVSVNQSISITDITAGRFTFSPVANHYGSGYASFSFKVGDGTALSASAYLMSVNVAAVNDAPAGADKTVTLLEDFSYTFAAADFGFADTSDNPANALLAVKITTLPGAGSLKLNNVAVTAGQTVALADLNAGLLKFTPIANTNGNGYASFTFQVQDNGGTANGGVDLDQSPNTFTFNVTPVNDTPAGADTTKTMLEDGVYTFAASDFGLTDPADSPANTLLAVKITTLPGAGSLKLNNVAVTAGQTVALADLNAGLLKFTPIANTNGNGYASFTFQVQDNGGTANGGLDLDQSPNSFTFNITAVNDAPAGTNKSVTLLEDAIYTLAASDFGFTDSTDSPANTLLAVKITTLPGAGSLKLNGLVVTVDQSIAVTDITAGNFKFTPTANTNGNNYASLNFQVQDNGGTVNGGVDLAASANNLSFNVTAVNDAPTLTVFAPTVASGNEDTEIMVTFANLQNQGDEADVDGTVTAFVVKAISSGTLKIGSSAATATAWSATINNTIDTTHQAYWTPAVNANGALNAFAAVAKDNGGAESSTAIQAAVAVAAVNDKHTGTVTLQGITIDGQTLTASHTLADLDGLGTVNYQWQASTDGSTWTAINGETANSLQLTQTQVGQFIRVHASFIDGGGTLESQDSEASNQITAQPGQVISGTHGNDALVSTTANDSINGGFGFDTVRESGVLTDYAVSQSGNSVVLTNNLTGAHDVLTDIERVIFDSGNNLTIAYTEAEAVARHLMTNWLHRDLSVDEGGYVLQHLTTYSATEIANVFLTLPEASGLTNKSAAELLAGYESHPLMQRVAALHEVTGGDGNDRGTLPFGVAVSIDGGQGHDVLDLLETRNHVNIAVNGNTLELTRNTDGAMLDLKNAEMITFSDGNTVAIAHDPIEGILGRLVHTFFDRNATAEEWQSGRDALAQHIAPDAILNWFQDNAGLTQLTDSAYIQTLFQNTFNRAATTTEQNNYLTQLHDGSLDRSWLAVDLAQSQEAVTIIGSQVLVMDGWM